MTQIGKLRNKLASAKPEMQKVSRLSIESIQNSALDVLRDNENKSQNQDNYEKIFEPFKESEINKKPNSNRSKIKGLSFDDMETSRKPEKMDLKSGSYNFGSLTNRIAHEMNDLSIKNHNKPGYQVPDHAAGHAVTPATEKSDEFYKAPGSAVSGVSRQTRISTARKIPKHFVPVFHEPSFKMSQTKVQYLVRQSTRNRFSNIYKFEESFNNNNTYNNNEDNNQHVETTNNKREQKSNISKAAVNSLDNFYPNHAPSVLNKNLDISPNNNNNQKSLNKLSLRAATNLSSKSLPNKTSTRSLANRAETAIQKRKLHPSIRYQLKKDDEPQCIENIINDVPSSIKIMSRKGKATNIEKLIAVKLTEYYTNNRLVY